MPNEQSRVKRRKQLRQKKKPLWKKIFIAVALLFLLASIAVGGVFAYYIATAPKLDPEKLSDPFSSKVYDKNGEVIAEFGTEKRTKIEFDDLPDILIDAVTATEDVRFFKHRGIDLRRIAGAIKANITRGFGAEGASTITQQVVENAFLSPEKKIKYKVQEQWLALKLEREYSKEQILEMYLNKIFYGSNAYGVAKAAEVYFGKTDLHDLTLPEAAILAGLPQRPSAYNPYVNPDLMKKRMDTVLNLMVRHGKITEEEADEARDVEIESLLAGQPSTTIPYEGFIQKVRKELEEKLDVDLDTDGVEVYTTLDTSIQEHVEFLLTDSDENPIPYPDDEMQVGMTVVNTQTGEILAIGGQRNSEKLDGFNYAFQGGGFQPGSTVKPIISYGPAIEYNKISTYHQLNDDKPYEVPGSSPIRNWNRQYHGWVSARYALTQSLNVPTVKLVNEEVGLENAQEFAEGLGIKFHNDQINLRDAIGGTETNVTPLQLAGAFSAFGNEGIYHEPYAVTKVVYPDGNEVSLKSKPEVAMSDYTAYMVTDMLKSVVREGTGTLANIPGLPVAGKTGTTNLPTGGAPDAWFTGYTTNFTISIWAGGYQDDDGKRAAIPGNGTQIPRLLFKETMTEISKDIETPDFIKPDSVVEVEVEKGSNPPKLPSEFTPRENIVKELFVKGHEPKEISDTFDKLDPAVQLSASYNESENAIEVTWQYDADDDIEFEVSASVDDGEMKVLSTTSEQQMTIYEVEPGSEYTIQVIVVKDELRSDPASIKYIVPEDEEEEEMQPVSQLSAIYDESKQVIKVSWKYDGPDAQFEVVVNPGQASQVVSGNQLDLKNPEPGETYTIEVTPISNQTGEKAESRSTEVTIPALEEPEEPDPEEEEPEEENEEPDESEDESDLENQQEKNDS